MTDPCRRERNKRKNNVVIFISALTVTFAAVYASCSLREWRLIASYVRYEDLKREGAKLSALLSQNGYPDGYCNRDSDLVYTNSVDLIRFLVANDKEDDTTIVEGIECRGIKLKHHVKDWIVAKNLPQDADGNAIKIASRNMSRAALKTTLSEEELDSEFPLGKVGKGVLSEITLIQLNNGRWLAIRHQDVGGRRVTYRDVYKHAFSLKGDIPISYLEPSGEFFPGQSGIKGPRSPSTGDNTRQRHEEER
ncbi:MAG: hypothetical protein J6334_12000 [Kiritimatiellae bacterium]|nr:hypothetical protein [Kiritimatiellia bacterium]